MGISNLFRPKHQSKDPDTRLEAVLRMEDQKLLAQLAKSDKSPRVRMAAVTKVDDQELLVSIALDGAEIDSRIAAVECIESQQRLADIIKARRNYQLMGACFARITDRKILEAIANDPEYNRSARRIAIENFADESFLAEVSLAEAEPAKPKSREEIDKLIRAYGGARLVQAMGRFRGSPNAIRALGEIMRRGGDAAFTALEYLAQALIHANPEISQCAKEELASTKDAALIAHLIRLSDKADLHEEVMTVIRQIDHPDANQFVKEKEDQQ
jgi:hypothetical protein